MREIHFIAKFIGQKYIYILYFENDAIQGHKITILLKENLIWLMRYTIQKFSIFCMSRNIINLDGVAYEYLIKPLFSEYVP